MNWQDWLGQLLIGEENRVKGQIYLHAIAKMGKLWLGVFIHYKKNPDFLQISVDLFQEGCLLHIPHQHVVWGLVL